MPADHADSIGEQFERLRTSLEGPERDGIVARLVEQFRPLAERIARRFRDRGETLEDLRQVAAMGLVQAVHRFDPAHGTKFITFATHTISGEVKRHFRDRAWGLHVPRRLQELNLQVRRAADRLTQELGRSPAVVEIASAVGISEETALEALELGQCAYDLVSLDELAATDADGSEARHDRQVPSTEDLDLQALDVRAALRGLEPRLRHVLIWRFVGGYSQQEVGRRLGISQMHVSRLQSKALRELRARLTAEGE